MLRFCELPATTYFFSPPTKLSFKGILLTYASDFNYYDLQSKFLYMPVPKQNAKARVKRVNVRDLVFLLEHEPPANSQNLLYKAHLK